MLLKFYHIAKRSIRTLLVPVLPIVLLSACSSDEAGDDLQPQESQAEQYINLTITVSSGSQQEGTRATPKGGEDGDGRELGLERESAVSGITFILADGPLSDNTAKIALIKYYEVTEVTTGTYPTDAQHNHTDDQMERKYTTGNQPIRKDELSLTEDKTYYIYVVANRRVAAEKGDDLRAIRDNTLRFNQLFIGDGYIPDGCRNFVMASDHDVTVNFTNRTDITLTETSNAAYYTLNNPIVVERLAARIDFCTAYAVNTGNTKNAAYDTYLVNVNGTSATITGFKYETTPDNSGFFILETVIPFNLYNEKEYLFERVTSAWPKNATSTTYLGKETAENYVVDPRTDQKNNVTGCTYINGGSISGLDYNWWRAPQYLAIQASKTTVINPNDNYVLAYCMENTLMPSSQLNYYATGFAIIGSYYDKNGNFLIRRTFFDFLRHHDNGTTYTPREITNWNDYTGDNRTCASGIPMNFGIVRNNIYRVNIESVDSRGKISVRLAVHDWREVTHPQIYL